MCSANALHSSQCADRMRAGHDCSCYAAQEATRQYSDLLDSGLSPAAALDLLDAVEAVDWSSRAVQTVQVTRRATRNAEQTRAAGRIRRAAVKRGLRVHINVTDTGALLVRVIALPTLSTLA